MTLFDNIPEWDPIAARKPSDAVSHAGASSPGTTGVACSPVRRPDGQPRKADDGYFNTTGLTGRDLEAARKDARTQYDRVRLLFASMPDGWTASPSKVHRLVGGAAPITSIRRAMTVLTEDGVLTRTAEKVIGPYGKVETTWRKAA